MADPIIDPAKAVPAAAQPAPAAQAQPAADPAKAPAADPAKPADANDSPEDVSLSDVNDKGEPKGKADVKDDKKQAPDKYEFKLPEGFEIDQKAMDVFTPIFKELDLDNAKVQKLVDAYAPVMQGIVEKTREQSLNEFKSMVDEWKVETNKELGADAKTKLAYVGKALNKHGTPELRALLNQTGVGNHKEVVKFLINIGKTISEDTFVDPDKGGPPDPAQAARKMYPTMAS